MGFLLGSPAFASAQPNIPPVARASADPLEVLVLGEVRFTGSRSLDPDMGPEPLRFAWDFGDGATSTDADATHRYAAPGPYDVTLMVSDGRASALVSLTVHVLAPVTPGPPSRSSPIALDPARARLYVANPDSGSITSVDTAVLAVADEATIGSHPTTLALSADGSRLFVVCRDDGELRAVDPVTLEVLARTSVGHQPFGVAVDPADGRVIVTAQGLDRVFVLDPDGAAVRASLGVADGPRGVAVTADGRRAFVTHFVTRGDAGTVTVVDLASERVATEIRLVEDPSPDTASSGAGFPNLLSAIAIDPAGRFVWVGGLKSNSSRGAFLDGEPFVPVSRVRGVMARIEVETGFENVLRRIDSNNADSISAIELSPNGRRAYVTHAGAGMLSVYDLSTAELTDPTDGSTVAFDARIDVGHAPRGLALSGDGRRLYVSNELSRDLSVVDVSDPAAPVAIATIAVTAEPLPADVANGKRLFHRSRAPRHAQDNYIACASCHPDGGQDGRVWDITQYGEGLRNTIDLRGRAGTGHGPVHWSANFDEIQDFENDIVNAFGGTGLAGDGEPPFPPLGARRNGGRSRDLDDLAAYVASLREGNPSPQRNPDGSLTDEARRGRALFEDTAVGCAACHAAPRFTDSTLAADPASYVLHDVGTLGEGSGRRLGGPLSGLDTPSLIGLWDTAPYLHDGSAASLRDVLVARNPDDRHGITSGLAEADLDDLVAYLLQIDGRPDDPAAIPDAGTPGRDAGPPEEAGGADADGPVLPRGGGCTVGHPRGRPPADALALLVLLMLAMRRRRPLAVSGPYSVGTLKVTRLACATRARVHPLSGGGG